jgi:hypothetical protein
MPGTASNGSDDDRVVWVDFDIALNFGSGDVGWRLQYDESKEAAFEEALVKSYGKSLVSSALYIYIYFVYFTHVSLGKGSERGPVEEYKILLKIGLEGNKESNSPPNYVCETQPSSMTKRGTL